MTPQPVKVWTLPAREVERALRIPEGWHIVAVRMDPGEVVVTAHPDKAAA